MLEPARGNLSQTEIVRTGPALSRRTREGQGTRFLGGERLGQPPTSPERRLLLDNAASSIPSRI